MPKPKRGGRRGSGGFKKFKSKKLDEYEYEDDDGKTAKFFKENSNSDQLISEMTRDERNDFRQWTQGHFMFGQQHKGFDNMSEYEQDMTRTFDKYLDQATLDKGIEVSRMATAELVLGKGRTKGSLEELRLMEGQIVTSKGAMSTAAASEGLQIGWSKKKDVEYHITIPGGTKGAGMWIGDHRINGWGDQQREFMVNRDTSFRVGKTTYDKKRGVYKVNLEYIGLQDHDYGTQGR